MKWWVVALGLVAGLLALVIAALYYAGTHIFGDCDPYCNALQFAPVRNRSSDVAIVRREYSGGLPDDYSAVANAVYVHRASQSNTNENLVLRYYALEEKGTLPVVRWTGVDSLVVIVPARRIVQVTRERSTIGRIAVTYRLPHAACRATSEPVERPQISRTCDYGKQFDDFVFSSLYEQTKHPGRHRPRLLAR